MLLAVAETRKKLAEAALWNARATLLRRNSLLQRIPNARIVPLARPTSLRFAGRPLPACGKGDKRAAGYVIPAATWPRRRRDCMDQQLIADCHSSFGGKTRGRVPGKGTTLDARIFAATASSARARSSAIS